MLSIEKQIEQTDIAAIDQQIGPFPFKPYEYQYAAYQFTADVLRSYPGPVVIRASVSAGKTVMISMIALRIMQMNESMASALVISRGPEIVSQDASEMLNFGVNNSIFSAKLGMKSTKHKIITGSEGTIIGALETRTTPGVVSLSPITEDRTPMAFKYDSRQMRSRFFKVIKGSHPKVKVGALAEFSPVFLLIDECHEVNVDDIIESEDEKESTIEEMELAGRNQYTIIIRLLQMRCVKTHGCQLRIIGYTGTDYRGQDPIINEDMRTPGFWRKKVCDINTEYLVKFGSVVPTFFGDTSGLSYDLHEFKSDGKEGVSEFSDAELKAMQKKILQQGTLTQQIMQQVHQIAERRNGVLVTCAGLRHCKEAASALPAGVTYAIITGDTPDKVRQKALDDCFAGRVKYVFQIMALTTGVNQPLWDTSVILRRIRSRTLLDQLLGRGMRKLKPQHIDAGFVKEDHLVLDYAGTMDDMAEVYFSPMLEQYQYEKAKINGETKECPACGFKDNSFYSRRCINEIGGVRCEHFYTFRLCEDQKNSAGKVVVQGCGTKNDVVARTCRGCDCTLLDPNLKLSGKHYTLDDYCDVLSMEVSPGRTGNELVFKYQLEQDGHQFKAYEIFHPGSDNRGAKDAWLHNGINKHVISPVHRKEIKGIKDITALMRCKSYFMTPTRVTHRKINDGKKDVISRKEF